MPAGDVHLIMAHILHERGVPIGDDDELARLQFKAKKTKEDKEIKDFLDNAKWI